MRNERTNSGMEEKSLKEKSVIVSIRPEWCEKIVSGEKSLELRKAVPNTEFPFVCFIYCTSVRNMPLERYVEVHKRTGGAIDDWSGKVIGWFICDEIVRDITCGHDALVNGAACVDEAEAEKYANGRPIIAWHISNLHLYDEPKTIDEFHIQNPPRSFGYCWR